MQAEIRTGTQTRGEGISFGACRAIALLMVAYALFHGWADIFFIGEIVDLPTTACNSHQVFILFRTLGFFACFALSYRLTTIANRRGSHLACAALLTMGTALMLTSAFAPEAAAFLQFGGAGVGGLGIGLASMLWFESITLLKPPAALACYLLSALITLSLITPLYAAGFEALAAGGFAAAVLTPLVIWLGTRFVAARRIDPWALTNARLITRAITLLSLFGFALAFREPMIGNQMFASGSYTAVGSLAMALIILVGVAIWGPRFRISFVFRILLPLTAVAFLLLPAQFPLMGIISDTCGSACDELVKILCIVILTHQCWRNGASALRLFGLAYTVHGALVFLGGQACLVLMAQGVSEADLSAWFNIIAALAIAATIFILPNDQDLAPISLYEEEADSPAEPDDEDAARAVALRFGLTARESEILELMLKGKGIDDIAAELVIARETVKTHRRNLFLKCEIHSEEELRGLARRET
ncbi:response regulator transcription factor [Gordonibacter sp. An230]|uniref:response regulator transcription factor n=1 Tax=Gordonibacter sp. An230 TaxID=1965592 RepID=UPI0013A6412C|nr:helix-turn-helix transcriptional regulator [Gordonibacter sp. An230]